jgi:hypothetical protein
MLSEQLWYLFKYRGNYSMGQSYKKFTGVIYNFW